MGPLSVKQMKNYWVLFREGLFSWNFAFAKFREIKSSRNGEIILSFTNEGKSCHIRKYVLNIR